MHLLLTILLSGPAAVLPGAPGSGPTVATPAAPRAVEAMLDADTRRVRTGSQRLTKLLFEGVRRSPTFADLVAKVHATDVIVYVEPSWSLPPELAGRILLQVVAGNQRYLRMQVRASLSGDQIIAVMAHELRHALEVAEEPAVINDAGLIALYRKIGHPTAQGHHAFDTTAAVVTGRIVADELLFS